ncbi:MAG TPA: DUF1801 domain-containing protein [Thermoanaerobaculia bacterium]|nr:DUF1801 domain-containing protein [Thermoanaerobaculia bacterium]
MKPKTIDEYLAALSPEKRAALERLREIVLAEAPGAQECISYQIPAFRLDGRVFLWIGAAAKHCALYGVSGAALEGLGGYDTSGKGTLRFKSEDPLPEDLVRKLVRAGIAKSAARRRGSAARPAEQGADPNRPS